MRCFYLVSRDLAHAQFALSANVYIIAYALMIILSGDHYFK